MTSLHAEDWLGLQWLQGLNQSACCERDPCIIQMKCTNKKIIRKIVDSLTRNVNFHNFINISKLRELFKACLD